MSKKNAEEILEVVEKKIEDIENGTFIRYPIRRVYKELSIFDWWNDYLSFTQLKDMRHFLMEAIKLGYNGYVCFKVGAEGCASGMWAYKKESEDGFSPDGAALYRSFYRKYNWWQVCTEDGEWLPNDIHYNDIKSVRELERFIAEHHI